MSSSENRAVPVVLTTAVVLLGTSCGGMAAGGQTASPPLLDGRAPTHDAPAVDAGRGTTAGPASTVATGNGHTCAIREARSLWCWGVNNAGQLGLQAQRHCTLVGEREPCQLEPARVDAARCPSKGDDGSVLGPVLPPMPGD